jgi:hypothetical protein
MKNDDSADYRWVADYRSLRKKIDSPILKCISLLIDPFEKRGLDPRFLTLIGNPCAAGALASDNAASHRVPAISQASPTPCGTAMLEVKAMCTHT